MSGKIIEVAFRSTYALPDLCARLDNFASILRAIHVGELLDALPDCTIAQSNHLAALNLLAMLERDIERLRNELG